MTRRWEFRLALGLVPEGTVFSNGHNHGVLPRRSPSAPPGTVLLPISPPIPVQMTAQGLAQLEAYLVTQIRDFVGSIRRLHPDDAPAEFYSFYEVQP